MRAIFVVGRTIFGGFFAWNGLLNILARQQKSFTPIAQGVPAPDVSVPRPARCSPAA